MARGVPSTVSPLCPVAPEQPGRARSGVRLQPCGKDANGDYANRVGDGLQNRAWLGSTPAIASHRIRAKRDGYMPPLVSGFAVRRQHAGQGAHHHRRSRHTTVHMVAVPHRRHLRRRNGLPIARRTRLRSSVGQSSIPLTFSPRLKPGDSLSRGRGFLRGLFPSTGALLRRFECPRRRVPPVRRIGCSSRRCRLGRGGCRIAGSPIRGRSTVSSHCCSRRWNRVDCLDTSGR